MLKRYLACTLSMLTFAGANAQEPKIDVTNCRSQFNGRFDGKHESAGPYRLVSVHCIQARDISGLTRPAMSPDGSAFAWLNQDEAVIADVSSGQPVSFRTPISTMGFQFPMGEPPIGWSNDSRTAWSAKQDVLYPSHFPVSGLTVMRLMRDGSTAAVTIKGPSVGPLDGVQWIRNSALAIAQFGTNGGFYRPPHADPAPELAMIDAAHGTILDRLALNDLSSFRQRKMGFDARFTISAVTAVVVAGHIRSIVTIIGPHRNIWVRWTQGTSPVETAAPIAGDQRAQVVLTPSGDHILVARDLQPDGVQISCEGWNRNCPTMPPPEPRTGPLLELRDYQTGNII